MKIRLQMFDYRCGNCEQSFAAPELVVGEYLLMRSEGAGTIALLSTVDNRVLDEVDRLVRELPLVQGRSEYEIGGLTQAVLSAVFDPDDDGSRFVVGGRPRCPSCGWSRLSEWSASDPPRIIEVDVPLAGHIVWDELKASDKRSRVAEAVADALSA
jgi:hypothetical protein